MPLVKELVWMWWEEQCPRLDGREQEETLAFLERYLLRFLGEEELQALTQRRLDAYFTQILFEQMYRNPSGKKQVVYGKPLLQALFDYAAAQGLASGLPKAELSFRINIQSKSAPVGCDWSEELQVQIHRLMQSEKESLTGLAMGLALYAGFNREEILSLRRDQIDFACKKLKHKDGREVPLEEPLWQMLSAYLEQFPEPRDGLLFLSNRKTPFAGPSLSHLVKLFQKKHGIEQESVGLNALRNQYILHKLNTVKSDELPAFAAALGASPINLLNTFGHLIPRSPVKAPADPLLV